MSYTNADGLRVLTGLGEGTVQDAGTQLHGPMQTLVKEITFTALGTTFTSADIDLNDPMIPANALIINADLIMTAAATSGGSATLTIGTYLPSGTAVDADGIDATVALTAMDVIGDVVQCDGAQVNGLLTVGTAAVYVGALYATAAFTAGVGTLVVQYIVP